jgi:hypothetical protein
MMHSINSVLREKRESGSSADAYSLLLASLPYLEGSGIYWFGWLDEDVTQQIRKDWLDQDAAEQQLRKNSPGGTRKKKRKRSQR